MRKILTICVILLSCLSLTAQDKLNLSDVKSLTFYGIDFSLAKVYGGKDTGHQYWTTYADINELFIDKPKTFSVEKRLGIPVDVIGGPWVLAAAASGNTAAEPGCREAFRWTHGVSISPRLCQDAWGRGTAAGLPPVLQGPG